MAVLEKPKLIDELLRRGAERSLSSYVRQAWPIIEPSTPMLPNWHIDLICEYLEAVTAGEIRRLCINIPPRMSKSLLVSVLWPTWEWIRHPSMRWLFASYSGVLSVMHSKFRRDVIESPWYQARWGDRVQLAGDQNQKTEYQNTATGRMVATSVTGTATGKGGNRIVIDDPQNPVQIESEAERDAAIEFYAGTLSTRLDDKKTGAIVLIMQRLHEMDLTGHIMRTEKDWTHLMIPMRAESPETWRFPRSARVEARAEGALLCPARYDEGEDARQAVVMGSYRYAGQMQQRPVPAGGGVFVRKHVQFYRIPPETFEAKVQAWDLAFKDLKTSDRVAGSVWGKRGSNMYLLDAVSDQMGVLASANAIKALAAKHPDAHAKLIEDAANGPAVCEILRQQVPGLILVPTGGGKIARAYAAQPYWEAGNVWLPDPEIAPWVNDWVEEIVHFPKWAHDDRVDSMTHAINYLALQGGGIAAFYEQQAAKLANPRPNGDMVETIEVMLGGRR